MVVCMCVQLATTIPVDRGLVGTAVPVNGGGGSLPYDDALNICVHIIIYYIMWAEKETKHDMSFYINVQAEVAHCEFHMWCYRNFTSLPGRLHAMGNPPGYGLAEVSEYTIFLSCSGLTVYFCFST